MNEAAFEDFLQKQRQLIDDQLPAYIDRLHGPEVLKDAMRYSLQAGGKRLRPILLLATMDALGADSSKGLPIACAIEMVHTYSLIHDDLPAMDDDDLRRGNPTNHKVFGEAMAILAGDGLLTYSFEVMGAVGDLSIPEETKLSLYTAFAQAAGPEGMVAGQIADLGAEGRRLTLEELESIHLNKTGKLMGFAIVAGAMLAQADEQQTASLKAFSKHLGLAFQIQDDILDVEGDAESMGKASGSDISRQKSTYPQLLTLDGAKKKLHYHTDEAKRHLFSANVRYEILEAICEYIGQRRQ